MNNELERLLKELKSFDLETYHHSKRVGQLAYDFNEFLKENKKSNYNSVEIKEFGYLHDIGKMFIDKDILIKKTLNKEEFENIKQHTIKGYMYLKNEKNIKNNFLLNVVLFHHQYSNQTPYIDYKEYKDIELTTSEIFFIDLIIICDIYDALTNERTYKPAYSKKDSLDTMSCLSGVKINPDLFMDFLYFIYTH